MQKLQRGAAHQVQMTTTYRACSRKFFQRYVPPPVQGKQRHYALPQGSPNPELRKTQTHYKFNSCLSSKYLDYSHISLVKTSKNTKIKPYTPFQVNTARGILGASRPLKL